MDPLIDPLSYGNGRPKAHSAFDSLPLAGDDKFSVDRCPNAYHTFDSLPLEGDDKYSKARFYLSIHGNLTEKWNKLK